MNSSIKKKLTLTIISMIIVICMSVNLEVVNNFGEYFNTFNAMDFAYVILYYLLFTKISNVKDRRAKVCCAILAIIFRTM